MIIRSLTRFFLVSIITIVPGCGNHVDHPDGIISTNKEADGFSGASLLSVSKMNQLKQEIKHYSRTNDLSLFTIETGTVTFSSEMPLVIFEGKSESIEGLFVLDPVNISSEKNKSIFFLKLATIKTGNPRRDKHMRELYLETEKYPYALFTDINVEGLPSVFTPADRTLNIHFSGIMNLHGVSKKINGIGNAIMNKSVDGSFSLSLSTSFTIYLDQFNITVPDIIVMKLNNSIPVTVNLVTVQNISPISLE